MWDRPDLLNSAARALYGLAALLALVAAIAFTLSLPVFPLREIRLESAPAHVTRDEIERRMRGALKGNFFTLDLEAVRASFMGMPWVRNVELRRHWPDRLEVTLEEHVPLARWATVALVNTHGEIFKAPYAGALPVFVGPEGAAKEMAIQYEFFRRGLSSIGQRPAELLVSPRRAWRLKLASGITLELGREHIEARFTRFVAAYERTLATLDQEIEYVDLRYANGFAVRVPPARPREPARGDGRKTG
ncbi:MAG TPA: cell division protein FtsQ/DivIB [Burkholderiales bacterium]|jgi:cell division protein FtsQ|nr:cell division protein FtsQ/DivIB [Burkholderiales bacterium]